MIPPTSTSPAITHPAQGLRVIDRAAQPPIAAPVNQPIGGNSSAIVGAVAI